MSEIQKKPRPRWLRFSLRTLLIVVTLVSVAFGLWISPAIRQRNAVAALTKANETNSVDYDYYVDENCNWTDGEPPGPEWLRELLGIDYFATIAAAYLTEANDDQLLSLKDLSGLRKLDLSACYDVTDKGVEHLRALTGLRILDVSGSQMTDKGLAALQSLAGLQTLGISDCDRITDAGFADVSKIKSLRTFRLSQCAQVTNRGMAQLSRLARLETLELSFTDQVTDAVLENLQALPSLRRLELCYVDSDGGPGLGHLGGLPRLKELVVYGWDALTDKGFSHLRVPASLSSIFLVSCKRLTDDSLKNLDNFPNLQELSLSCPGLGDRGMVHLQRLPKLASLSIWGDDVVLTDSGLESIGQLSALRKLRLNACRKITDDGLAKLAGLSNLDELDIEVDDLKQISAPALDKLSHELPKCTIDYREKVRGM